MPKNSEERDKLLQELAYLEQAEYIDKQIYAQLVGIVEQHFSESRQVRGLLDRYNQPICEGDKVLAIPYEHITKKREVGIVFWMDEYSAWGVQIWDNEEKGMYHSYLFSQLNEIEVLERKPDTEAEQKIPPTVFSEKLVEDCWKEHDAKVDKERAEQSGEVDEDVQELIDWLQKCIDRPAMIQVSHPHLAWYPTEKDKANWQKVKQLLTQQPVQVDEEKKIEEIRMMIQKATSEYMPVYRRIYLNDAVEVEIRKLLARQPVQVDELIEGFDEMVSHFGYKGSRYSDLIVRIKTAILIQKRTVTRAWIEKELNAHLRLEDEALRDYVHVVADIIVDILTDFGIEVTTEK